jgi:hypothetical protein
MKSKSQNEAEAAPYVACLVGDASWYIHRTSFADIDWTPR